ncbi:MAG: DUF2878 domain-containing protein [Pseudomonadota bacterium]
MNINRTWANVINAIALNLVWMCAVVGAAVGQAWFGPVAMSIFVLGHLPYADRHDLRIVLVLLPLGIIIDSIYAATGMITYASPWPSTQFAPVWIISLWIAFALTIRHSMRLITEKLPFALLLGGVFGPVSYWFAGNVWGAAQFNWSTPAWFAVIGVSWAGVMALCHWLLKLEAAESAASLAPVAAAES